MRLLVDEGLAGAEARFLAGALALEMSPDDEDAGRDIVTELFAASGEGSSSCTAESLLRASALGILAAGFLVCLWSWAGLSGAFRCATRLTGESLETGVDVLS